MLYGIADPGHVDNHFRKVLIAYVVATYILSLLVFVRRMHDLDRSGWWLLSYFLPGLLGAWLGATAGEAGAFNAVAVVLKGLAGLLGLIFLIFLTFAPGTEGPNAYGSNRRAGVTVLGSFGVAIAVITPLLLIASIGPARRSYETWNNPQPAAAVRTRN